MRSQGNGSDNAEIVGASSESSPEITMLIRIGIDDLA